jgi:hypothetical protein
MVQWSGSGVDSFWHHLINIDPVALQKTRDHQKIALARYARQPLSMWDGRDVNELRRWYWALKDLLDQENEVAGAVEDR